jgi:hypothetical protein
MRTPSQTLRAARLVRALPQFPQHWRLCRTGDRLELTVEGESPLIYSIGLDGRTGRMILDAAERIVRAELRILGVKVRARR